MFATRLISGIILVVLALFLVGQGGVVLFLASLGISVIGQYELYRVTKMEDKLGQPTMCFCGMDRGIILRLWLSGR